MSNFIEISCVNCQKRYRVDKTNYLNKFISFKCNACDHQIKHFVPPDDHHEEVVQPIPQYEEENQLVNVLLGGKAKQKKQKSVKSIFKDIALKTKEKISDNASGVASADPVLRQQVEDEASKLPKKLDEMPEAPNVSQQPIKNQTSTSISQEAIQPAIPEISPQIGQIPGAPSKVDMPAAHYSPPAEVVEQVPKNTVTPVAQNNQAIMHIPKPGMPFISTFATPGFYKAGSTRRKDFSFIISELANIRQDMGIDLNLGSLDLQPQPESLGDIPETRKQIKIDPASLTSPPATAPILDAVPQRIEPEIPLPEIPQDVPPVSEQPQIPKIQIQVPVPPSPQVVYGEPAKSEDESGPITIDIRAAGKQSPEPAQVQFPESGLIEADGQKETQEIPVVRAPAIPRIEIPPLAAKPAVPSNLPKPPPSVNMDNPPGLLSIPEPVNNASPDVDEDESKEEFGSSNFSIDL